MVSEDGALFYRVPSGEPLAFEPAMAVVDGLEAASVAIFVVSADGNEESQSGRALYAEATSADGRFVAYFRAPLPPEADPMLWRAGAELTLLDLDRGTETTFQDPTFANLANECPLAFVPAPPRLVALDYNAWSFRVPDLRLLGKRPTSPVAFPSLGLPDPPPQPDCGQINTPAADPPPARICEREGLPLPLGFCPAAP
ncbi:MAG: hypothetical protein R3B72_38050 [Polyangiaceae bacterium]